MLARYQETMRMRLKGKNGEVSNVDIFKIPYGEIEQRKDKREDVTKNICSILIGI